MFRFLLAAVIAVASASAGAKVAGTPVEASMLVTGTVDIEIDGSVSAHAIDDQDRLPGYVVDIVRRAADSWRFQPVLADGTPVPARARMTLRLLATPVDDDEMQVSISGASFGGHSPDDTGSIRKNRVQPPRYPPTALEWGAAATAYIVLKVGRDGRVAEAFAEQVNLHGVADAKTMTLLRTRFAEASLKAARRWTFTPPTTGGDADDPYWSVRMPVQFLMGRQKGETHGEWLAYVPGPRESAPWMDDRDDSNDAIAGGSLQLAGKGLRLLTPLQPDS